MIRPSSLKEKKDEADVPMPPFFGEFSKYFKDIKTYVAERLDGFYDKTLESIDKLKKDTEYFVRQAFKGLTGRMDKLEMRSTQSLDEITDRIDTIDDLIKDSLTLNDSQHDILTKEVGGIRKFFDSSMRDLSSRTNITEKDLSAIPQEMERRVSSLRKYFSDEIKRIDDQTVGGELKSLWKLVRELEERVKKLMRSEKGMPGGTQVQIFSNGAAKALTYGINFIGATVAQSNITGVDVTLSAAFPAMTQAARLALTPINGQTAYDTTLNTAMIYVNGQWGTILLN